MSLLPDIINGELVLSKEEKKLTGYQSRGAITPERRKRFEEELNKIKAKRLEKQILESENVMAELNNEGRAEVTADFEDSPFADRQPIAPETE